MRVLCIIISFISVHFPLSDALRHIQDTRSFCLGHLQPSISFTMIVRYSFVLVSARYGFVQETWRPRHNTRTTVSQTNSYLKTKTISISVTHWQWQWNRHCTDRLYTMDRLYPHSIFWTALRGGFETKRNASYYGGLYNTGRFSPLFLWNCAAVGGRG
jgi:hypothetical protein